MDPITLSLAKAYTEATAEGMGAIKGEDGVSPIVQVAQNANQDGTVVTITDVNGAKSFEVLNGTNGTDGQDGVGVPPGGTTGQILSKKTNADYDTEWVDKPTGDGGGTYLVEVYSTEETRIGTWIDGKPLYRKVLNTTFPSANGQMGIWNLGFIPDTAVKCYGTVKRTDNGHEFLPITAGLSRNGETYLYQIGNWVYIFVSVPDTTWLNVLKNQPCQIVLEYTKTTDQPLNWWSPHITSNNTPSPYVVSATENDTS